MAISLETFLDQVRLGRPVEFGEVLAVIDAFYTYRPTRFRNGLGSDELVNEAGVNEGSCKIFYFARLHELSEAETLALFGAYYRDEVLADLDGSGHKNIRNFMKYGWAGIEFEGDALIPRAAG